MKIPIIPVNQTFVKKGRSASLNYKAICIFAATGFFLEKDTYFNDLEALQPATEYSVEDDFVKSEKTYWKWHYSPRDISFKQASEEFAQLFEKITFENLRNKKIILPLSGGLDSRTQAAALGTSSEVNCYSYKFANSFDETKYGKEICNVKNFPFHEFEIPKGYLWKVIDKLSLINQCYADFTHPRQMAVINEIKDLGNIFYLGHWGDVLFDDMGISDNVSPDELIEVLWKKIIKSGGLELAEALWIHWGLDGNFREYLNERISRLLSSLEIENANSRLRAFKSMYWAPRWTSANLNIFSNNHSIVLPYYDDAMCKFICTIPEKYLAARKIQIEYIKMKDQRLAEIPWQSFEPLNLFTYKSFSKKSRLPVRAYKKVKRILKQKISGEKLTTRNWEIQFKGESNDLELKKYLFENDKFSNLVSVKIVKKFYDKFKNENEVKYSHPVSMLLTMSLFSKNILAKV